MGERQSSYRCVSFVKYSQFTDRLLLHIRATLLWVRHNSAARFVSALLRTVSAKINCTKRLIRRCRALQRAKDLRDTGMSRLRKCNHMCSSNVSDTANRLLKRTDSEGSSSVAEKKSSVVPLFRSGRRSLICARLRNKGKVGVQRGRETAGVPSFLPPRRAPQSPALRRAQLPAEVQRKTLRPERVNTLTLFAHPGFLVQKKEPPVMGEPTYAVRALRRAVQKNFSKSY